MRRPHALHLSMRPGNVKFFMTRTKSAFLITLLSLVLPALAFAQGGGASSTGTIQGKVADAQGGVLPGVTVTASSPSMLGTQSTVTSETGSYRFPAVPPGAYSLVFELPGFNAVKRDGIQIALGFTATVNVELALASLQETVTVTGDSPVIDTTATRTVQTFKLEQLNSIPNGRDMWSLLAVTPGVQMAKIDVGGNKAGSQTAYTAYGLSGQARVLVEGINITEGTSGAGFYFDYASLDEVFLGTAGQSAEMGTPGVQSQFLTKSGGNRFSGEYYLDWYNNALQGSNLSDEVIAGGLRPGSNEIAKYFDTALNVGGPIKKDKIWYHASYRVQNIDVEQPAFRFDDTFNTQLRNPSVKGTYQLNERHKLIVYYQAGNKKQHTRLPLANYFYDDPSETVRQDDWSWVYKGEWNGTLSDKVFVEARYGGWGYYFPLTTNSTADYFWRDTALGELEGAYQRNQTDRDRKQLNGAATYFLDTSKGTHTVKAGAELGLEKQWGGYLQGVGGNIDHQYANGVANRVVFWFPTARNHLGSLRDNDNGNMLSLNNLDSLAVFLNDTWALGRWTFNLGARYDRYHSWIPEQEQLAFTNGPVSIPEAIFPEQDVVTWNLFVPRVGVTFDLSGNGRTVVKANYGLYYHNPGPGLAQTANTNQTSKNVTYAWSDLNGDKRWQAGEEGALISTNLAGTTRVDPDLKAPYSHDASVFLEHEIRSGLAARAGFVYKTEDDLWLSYQPGRPVEAYTAPFSFVDVGEDAVRGTADDRTLTLYGVPNALLGQFPVNNVVMNVPRYSRYKTLEGSITRRLSGGWSMSVGGSYGWLRDFPSPTAPAYPNNPNAPGVQDRSQWDMKVSGQYEGPWGIRFNPLLRYQAGANYARSIVVSAPSGSGITFNGTVYAGPDGGEPGTSEALFDYRQDNVVVLDLRSEKTVSFGSTLKLRAFLDLFNITNGSPAETINQATGTSFQRPSAILAPFTARLGFRFLW